MKVVKIKVIILITNVVKFKIKSGSIKNKIENIEIKVDNNKISGKNNISEQEIGWEI